MLPSINKEHMFPYYAGENLSGIPNIFCLVSTLQSEKYLFKGKLTNYGCQQIK